jgi:2-polyprenyl-3-methyl-5-hydroxy-6-metoxy-1,4-benzoquinol methylase
VTLTDVPVYSGFRDAVKTRDKVNQYLIDDFERSGLEELGLMNSSVWRDDPRRLLFTLSRYKFVAKMLQGLDRVAEIGCGDGFCARVVRQEVNSLTITDFDPVFVEQFGRLNSVDWDIDACVHDILDSPLSESVDAIYSLDVLEHIPREREHLFLTNVCNSLRGGGIALIGMPSLESQRYASVESKAGHVNCKTGDELRQLLESFFQFVFVFSMNDEIVHTGYQPMAHYLIALCCQRRV